MGQSIPIKRQSLSPKSNIREQIRNNLSRRFIYSKELKRKLAALAVGSPYGAEKEQQEEYTQRKWQKEDT